MRSRLRHLAIVATFIATTSVATTVAVSFGASPTLAARFSYASVSTGYHRSCAVTTEGIGLCWGWNYAGSLGTTDRSTTVLTPSIVQLPEGERFRSIEAGSYFASCGLTESGNVYCWGEAGPPGRLLLPADTVVTQLSVGASQVCALTSENELYCHGDWNSGELGVGDAEYTHLPVRVTLPDDAVPAYVSGGIGFTCVVATSGAAYCTGVNAAGQLGNGTSSTSKVYVRVAMPPDVRFTSISAGLERACAIDTAGGGWCWGQNYYGAFGDDTYANSRTPRPVATPADTVLTDIQTGWYHTCAITATGRTLCWGSNDQGALGWGQTYGGKTLRTALLPDDVVAARLEVGLAGTCVTSTDSRTFCWGANLYGSVGDGTTNAVYSPTEILRVGSPDPSTPAVTALATRSASIGGSFVPNGAASTVTVLVSQTADMSHARTVPVTLLRSQQSTLQKLFDSVSYSTSIFDLRPAATYFFAIRTSNTFGTSDSPIVEVTTLGGRPTLTDATTSNIGGDSATIDVTVDANLLDTTVTVEYATDPEFAGTVGSSTIGSATGDDATMLATGLTGLQPRTTYWARITASNEAGTSVSETFTFTTVGDAPAALSARASGGARGGTVTVSLDAGLLRTVVTVAHRRVGSSGSWTSESREVSGSASTLEFTLVRLDPATTYDVQISASNAAGNAVHPALMFTTAGGAPLAGSAEQSNVSETSVTLRAEVDSNDFATRVTLQIDTDESFANYDEWYAGTLSAGSVTTISLDVSNLVDSTTYYARFVAVNAKGAATSNIVTFTTATPVGKLLKRRLDPGDPEPIVEPTPFQVFPAATVNVAALRGAAHPARAAAKATKRTTKKTPKRKPSKRAVTKKQTIPR